MRARARRPMWRGEDSGAAEISVVLGVSFRPSADRVGMWIIDIECWRMAERFLQATRTRTRLDKRQDPIYSDPCRYPFPNSESPPTKPPEIKPNCGTEIIFQRTPTPKTPTLSPSVPDDDHPRGKKQHPPRSPAPTDRTGCIFLPSAKLPYANFSSHTPLPPHTSQTTPYANLSAFFHHSPNVCEKFAREFGIWEKNAARRPSVGHCGTSQT